jgi:hypothetical protein
MGLHLRRQQRPGAAPPPCSSPQPTPYARVAVGDNTRPARRPTGSIFTPPPPPAPSSGRGISSCTSARSSRCALPAFHVASSCLAGICALETRRVVRARTPRSQSTSAFLGQVSTDQRGEVVAGMAVGYTLKMDGGRKQASQVTLPNGSPILRNSGIVKSFNKKSGAALLSHAAWPLRPATARHLPPRERFLVSLARSIVMRACC